MIPNSSHHFLPPVAPPAGLFDRVMAAISVARLRQLRVRFAVLLTGLAASVAWTFANWQALGLEVRTSSFFETARLAMSDPDVVFSNLKDLALGLLESVPLWGILAVLLVAFFLVGAAAFGEAVRTARRDQHLPHHFAA